MHTKRGPKFVPWMINTLQSLLWNSFCVLTWTQKNGRNLQINLYHPLWTMPLAFELRRETCQKEDVNKFYISGRIIFSMLPNPPLGISKGSAFETEKQMIKTDYGHDISTANNWGNTAWLRVWYKESWYKTIKSFVHREHELICSFKRFFVSFGNLRTFNNTLFHHWIKLTWGSKILDLLHLRFFKSIKLGIF